MDLDDIAPKKDDPLSELERQELDSLSLHELDDRVARLEREIARVRAMRAAKESSRSVAENVFKS